MIQDTPSSASVRKFYDFFGKRYDLFSFYEARAKARALTLLDLAPGQKFLNVGVGTGLEHSTIKTQLGHDGIAYGVDISRKMLTVAHQRTGSPLCEADGRLLPFSSASFDRLLSAYTLDLIPAAHLPDMLTGFKRVLTSGGKMVLLSLTEGVNSSSRAFVSLWKTAYKVSPIACGGCRPLVLADLIHQAGLELLYREVVVQFGVPSEICVAAR